MYDRAPRLVGHVKPVTSDIVGPGAYDASVPSDVGKRRYDGYAPFGSLAQRSSSIAPAGSGEVVLAAPGPGSYNLDSNGYTRGTSTLQSHTRRFGDVERGVPGPADYSVTAKGIGISRSHTVPEARKAKMVVQRKADAPSIPHPSQAYGYEEGEDGTLKKQDAPKVDNSIGPAYYQKDVKSSFAANRGPSFAGYSKRKSDKPRLGPGPGEYDPYDPEIYVVENINAKYIEQRRPETNIPRFTEMVVKQEEKKGVPGPGRYDTRSMFEARPVAVNTEGIEVEQPPFMTQERRFKETKELAPGPGAYNDPRHALEVTKRITGLKRSPFGQTALRFSKSANGDSPGPNSYTVAGLGEQSLRKAYLESTRRGAFSSTEVRNTVNIPKSVINTPGPAHYQAKGGSPADPSKPSSMFVSNVKRLHEPHHIQTEVAPPAAYDVASSHDRSQMKMSHHNPRSDSAKKRSGGFNVSGQRLKEIAENPDMPGPGTYTAEMPKSHAKLALISSRDKRFKVEKERAPGPGAYEYSPLIMDTVLRGTFNATLNNPVTKKYEDHGLLAGGNQAFLLGV
jgi:hypothetical protein